MSADARAWEALVHEACISARTPSSEAVALGAAVRAVAGRVIPASAHRDQCAFEALRATGRAYASATGGRRVRMAAALVALAEECARLLGGVVSPPRGQEAECWRHRADCGDGA